MARQKRAIVRARKGEPLVGWDAALASLDEGGRESLDRVVIRVQRQFRFLVQRKRTQRDEVAKAVTALRTARNDAGALAVLLERRYGFEVELLTDATREEILVALRGLRERLTPEDNLLIYYAGHGWLDEAADEGYWLPVDATRDNEVNWIANSTVSTYFKAIRAKHILVVADSCYAGKLTRGIRVSVESQYAEEHSEPGSQWFFLYTVTIANEGKEAVQLVSRHWLITDATGHVQEVRGPGVVGEQPVLEPGEAYEYTSGCPLPTPFGSMEGTYQLVTGGGTRFDARIAPFELREPGAIH